MGHLGFTVMGAVYYYVEMEVNLFLKKKNELILYMALYI